MKSLVQQWVGFVFVAGIVGLSGCGGNEPPKANFEADLQRWEKEANPITAARGLVALGKQRREASDTTNAGRALEAAAKRAGEIKDPDERVITFNSIAAELGQLSQRTKMREAVKEVQGSIEKMSSDEARSKAYARMAYNFEAYLDDHNQAKHYFAEAEKTAKQAKDAPAQARGLIEVSRYLSFSKIEGHKSKATQLIAEAKAAAATIADDRARVDALSEIFVTLENAGNKTEAAAALEQVLSIARGVMDPSNRGHILILVSDRLKDVKRVDEAKKLIDEAYAASQKVADPSLKKELEEKVAGKRK